MDIRGVNLTGLNVTDVPGVVTGNLKVSLDASTYTSGTTWADQSGNSNNYTLVNSPTWSSSNQGIFTFSSASSQYVNSFDYNTSLSMGSSATTPFTFEIWAKPSVTTNSGILLDETSNVAQNGWHDSWMEFAGGNIRISVWANNPGFSLGAYTANNWYQIVMTYSGTTLKGYVNSVQQYTGSVTRTANGGTIYYTLAGPSDITNLGGGGGYFNGSIGAMRYYNRVLTADEVLQNYRSLAWRYGLV